MTALGDFTAGDVLTATDMNALPAGVLGHAYRTSAYTLTSSLADVGLSITFAAQAGRLYKAEFICLNAMGVVSGSRAQIRFILDATTIAIGYQGQVNYGQVMVMTRLFETTTASHTIKVQAYYDVGSGGEFYADANTPMQFVLQDIGEA